MNLSGIALTVLGVLTVVKLRPGAGARSAGRKIDPVYGPDGRPRRLPDGLRSITDRNPDYFTIYAGAYDDKVRAGYGSTEASLAALDLLAALHTDLTVHPPASTLPGGEPVASPGGQDDPRVNNTAETVQQYAEAGNSVLEFLNNVNEFFRGLQSGQASDGPAGVNGTPAARRGNLPRPGQTYYGRR